MVDLSIVMLFYLGLDCNFLDFPDGKSTMWGIYRFLNSFFCDALKHFQVGVDN